MGGNVEVNGKAPVSVRGMYSTELLPVVAKAYLFLTDGLVFDSSFSSGSTKHLFGRFDRVRNRTFSDIDVMVDQGYRDHVIDHVESLEFPVAGDGYVVHGYKKHGTQISFVVEPTSTSFDNCFQLDFEFKPFTDRGLPTPWAHFSQSSPYEDWEVGIKGVYHKQMMMSLTAANYVAGEFSYPKGSKIEEHPRYKFSVAYGLRKNVERTSEGTFRLVKPADATYLQSLEAISRSLLQINDFWVDDPEQYMLSLHSICRYINDNFHEDDLQMVVDDFYDRLLGTKNRVNRPEAEKQKVIETVCQLIPNLVTNPSEQQSAQDDSQDPQ